MNDGKVVRLQPDEVAELNRVYAKPMGAFMDCTCPKCKRRFGWTGRIIDRPPCPHCGHLIDMKSLEQDDKEIEAFEDFLIQRKRKREEEDD